MKQYALGGRALSAVIVQGLVVSMVMLGSVAVTPRAYAAVNNHSGTICKNYNAGEATLIDYLANGTRSYKTSATAVICPLTRNVSTSNGAYVYVDVVHSGTQTTSCTAYSHSYTGGLLASASQTWTGSGFHEFVINITGAGKSNTWSDYSVLCTIPGSSNGRVLGIDLNE